MKLTLLLVMTLAQTTLAASFTTDGKRIIAFGGVPASAGGAPTPRDMLGSAALIRSLPVDGLVINLTIVEGYFADTVLAKPAPAWEKLTPEFAAYAQLGRGRGAANHDFLRLNTSLLTADWFDDAAWAVFIENFRVVGRALAELGVRGIMLDTEAYAGTPFNYKVQLRRTEHDFAAYCAQARQRGRQLMAAVAESVPAPVVMLTFGPSAARPADGRSSIVENSMGLVPAFTRGLAEGAPRGKIIDGFEEAYTYRSHAQFRRARERITSPKVNAFPGFGGKPSVRAGFGLWLRRMGQGEGTLADDVAENSHSPAEWEHALHYALALADEYVWVYSIPWAKLPDAYRQAFAACRQPHALDFQPRPRPAENRPAAYIVSAKGRADTADAVVFAPFYRTHEELFDFPKLWQFRLDGEEQWREIRIDDWWEPQLNRTYLGAAWYKVEFTPPPEWKGRRLWLCFGAADEDAYVWLNGQSLGTHAFGADGWNTPFEFRLDSRLRFGKPNTLLVKVVNQAGVGGIWKSVKIFAPKPAR